MFPIVSKRPLNEAGTVLEYVIKAPLVAKKCLPVSSSFCVWTSTASAFL